MDGKYRMYRSCIIAGKYPMYRSCIICLQSP
jgi:hypothetical protein